MIDFFFRQRLLSNLTTIVVLLVGTYTAVNLPKEDFPNIDFDIVTVISIFPGATAEEVERLVTNPIEEEVRGVFGIKDLFSTSSEGISSVTVIIDPDYSDKEGSITDIQRAVDRVTNLPPEVEQPLVTEIKTARTPSILIAINEVGEPSTNVEPSLNLRRMANKVQRILEGVPNVAEVNIDGEEDLEFLIEVSTKKLQAFGISVDEITAALTTQNINVPGGEYQKESGSVRYRITNQLTNLEGLENVVLRATVDGQKFRLKDVAQIRLRQQEGTRSIRANGQPAMILQVIREEGTDVLKVEKAVRQTMSDFEERINGDGKKYQFAYASNLADIVRTRLGALSSSLIIGGVLVFFLLLVSLNLSTALLVALGIPFSFLGAVLLMPPLDLSLNLLTMFGFVMVLGMIVDDAIVVSESIFSKLEEGMSHFEAAKQGTIAVFVPVLGSVTTTVLAFAPLMFMSGIFGKFVSFIPAVVILCLLVSLLEAFFLLPNHMRDFSRVKRSQDKRHPFENVRDFYEKVVRYAVRRRYLSLFLGIVFVVISGGVFAQFGKGFDLFPDEGIQAFNIKLTGETSLSMEDMAEKLLPIERQLLSYPQEYFDAALGYLGVINVESPESQQVGDNYAQLQVFIAPEYDGKFDLDAVLEDFREITKTFEGIEESSVEKLVGGPPEGDPVNVFFKSDDLEVLRAVTQEAREVLEGIEGVTSITDTDRPGKSENVYDINFQRVLQSGINPFNVAVGLQMAAEGAFLGEVRSEVESTRLYVRSDRSEEPEQALTRFSVQTPTGELVPVINFLQKRETSPGVYAITHYDAQRSIGVSAQIDSSVTNAGRVNAQLAENYDAWLKKYPGLQIEVLGANRDTEESLASLKTTAIIVLVGVAFVMILTTGSLLYPLVILAATPLGFAGVLIVFLIHGRPLSFLSMMGVVGLLGVAVNVGIVLVDRIEKLKAELPFNEALIQGSVQRLRAVLLTSATTVFGLMPTAYGWGGGDPFLKAMALALGWGIAFASILGLIAIPVYLAIVEDIRSRFARP